MAIEKNYKCMATFRGFGKVLNTKFPHIFGLESLEISISISISYGMHFGAQEALNEDV